MYLISLRVTAEASNLVTALILVAGYARDINLPSDVLTLTISSVSIYSGT